MIVVESYLTGPLLNTPDMLASRYQGMMYDVDPLVIDQVHRALLPGVTSVLFSGGWRLPFDATYLELKMVKECPLAFHKSTLFVEPNNCKLYELTLQSLKSKNLVIVHSDYWTAHQPFNKLIENLDRLLKYVVPGGQVICTVPLIHLNFNRLTTRYEDLGFSMCNDSMIIVRG